MTPSNKKYQMPAEWAHHSATHIHWPSNHETWPGERLERVEEVYCRFIEELHFYEPVHIFLENKEVKERAVQRLSKRAVDLDRLTLHVQPINDVWARDCGPIFVKDEDGYVILNWGYNAWGEKYPPWEDDNYIPEYVASKYGIRLEEPGMILEGGSIEVNGDGLLMTTESVLLNPNRNPDLNRSMIEDQLKKYLGIREVIWLKRGLAGDDTDGHIDDIARFVNENTVFACMTEDKNDVNYEALQENLDILRSYQTGSGDKLNIIPLPMPDCRVEDPTVDGSEYVPASYANFYLANGAVFVPLYDPKLDAEILQLFRKYFKHRKVIGIPAKDLVWGQGSLHCITQQWYSVR
ncbi:agmatine/peptidylarginine deiminase [Balneola sp. MJW-20]|uniref:agmatine deiminase family protein n=1 Tax=Gracilimonas aurantiaca TaxID=3234185 RepID=UPI0034674EFE